MSIRIFIILLLWCQSIYAQTVEEVIKNSKAYYSNFQQGAFVIKEFYKPAGISRITESNLNGSFLKEGVAQFAFITNPIFWKFFQIDKAFYSVNENGKVEELSKGKAKNFTGFKVLNSSPFVYPEDFFGDYKDLDFKIFKTKDSIVLLSLEKRNIKLVFSTSNFELTHLKEVVLTELGPQISDVYYSFSPVGKERSFYLNTLDSLRSLSQESSVAEDLVTGGIRIKTGDNFPSFTFTTYQGNTFNIDSLNGKYILLDFFYTTCFPCIKSFPELNKLHKEFDRSRFVSFGIDPIKEDSAEMKTFIPFHKIEYEIVVGESAKRIQAAIGNSGYPTFILINPRGRVELIEIGYSPSFFKKVIRLVEGDRLKH